MRFLLLVTRYSLFPILLFVRSLYLPRLREVMCFTFTLTMIEVLGGFFFSLFEEGLGWGAFWIGLDFCVGDAG